MTFTAREPEHTVDPSFIAIRPLVRRTGHVMRPDPTRVVDLSFLPPDGDELGERSRTLAVLTRVCSLPEEEVVRALEETMSTFSGRHSDLAGLLDARFARMSPTMLARVGDASVARRRLLGACLTKEFAIEAAAVLNPSIVAHPDQSGLPAGTARFVMSLRGVGEGHISCIEFRTGTIDADDDIVLDVPGPTTASPRSVPVEYTRLGLERQNDELPGDGTAVAEVLAALPQLLTDEHLSGQLDGLIEERLERVAATDYATAFSPTSRIDARVLLPGSSYEHQGMEDLRLVQTTRGGRHYLGSYTAFDGRDIAQHLLRTDDFTTFRMTRLSGPGAQNKGMALFPRKVGGQYMALARWDGETNALATSTDLDHWEASGVIDAPRHSWEIVQSGNCGSPLETPDGWLVLTHGVGAMRQYSIGALLLDLEDPRIVIGHLDQPLLAPSHDERDGYVPNVVYSCGAMQHGETLVVPYGCSDAMIRIALVDVPGLLSLLRTPHPCHGVTVG